MSAGDANNTMAPRSALPRPHVDCIAHREDDNATEAEATTAAATAEAASTTAAAKRRGGHSISLLRKEMAPGLIVLRMASTRTATGRPRRSRSAAGHAPLLKPMRFERLE